MTQWSHLRKKTSNILGFHRYLLWWLEHILVSYIYKAESTRAQWAQHKNTDSIKGAFIPGEFDGLIGQGMSRNVAPSFCLVRFHTVLYSSRVFTLVVKLNMLFPRSCPVMSSRQGSKLSSLRTKVEKTAPLWKWPKSKLLDLETMRGLNIFHHPVTENCSITGEMSTRREQPRS